MGKKTKETPLFTAVGTIWAFGNQFQVAVEYEMDSEVGAFTKKATLVGMYLENHKFPTELNPPIPIDLFSDDVDRQREQEIEQIAKTDSVAGRRTEDTETNDGI